MALNGLIGACLILIFALTTELNADYGPPRITFPNESEYVIDATGKITLFCEGTKPITWNYPALEDQTKHPSIIKETVANTGVSIYAYGTHLQIENASYLDTGYYYCHETDTSDMEDFSKVAKLYLYVSDDEHLSVYNDAIGTILVTQYLDAVIPCRPTSPNVIVDLSRLTGEERIANLSYDPKIGFTFPINDISQQDEYTCTFKKGDSDEFETSFLVIVNPMIESIAKPYIEDMNKKHTVVGGPLHLKCIVRTNVHISMSWVTPWNNSDFTSKIKKETSDMVVQELYINSSVSKDQGLYTCVVKHQNHENNNTIFIRVYDKDEYFIYLSEENGVYYISVRAGEPSVQWAINVTAHPDASLEWFRYSNNDMELIAETDSKYEIHLSTTEAVLKIKDISIYDYGNYTLKAKNQFKEEQLTLFLNVTDKPTVEIESNEFHLLGENGTFKCTVAAHPVPDISWYYKPCQDDSCDFESVYEWQSQQNGLIFVSYLNISSNQSGLVMCVATNSVGNDSSTAGYFITDVFNGFNVWGHEDDVTIKAGTKEVMVGIGSAVTLHCGASVYNYTNEMDWFIDGALIKSDDEHYTIERSYTDFSNRVSLNIDQIEQEDSAIYSCRVSDKSSINGNGYSYANITFTVSDPWVPVIKDSNMNDDINTKFPDKLHFYCNASGLPKPIITWYKNNIVWTPDQNGVHRTHLIDENQRLIIDYTEESDEGTYKCEAKNRMGIAYKEVRLSFTNKSKMPYILSAAVVVIGVCLLVSVLLLWIKTKKSRKLKREWKKLGLANFEKGALENLNPELGVDDQAELLPYDKRYEFPRENLKLGKQLGSGAFGVVLKAQAFGIVDDEDYTTVAVKMVKRNADFAYIKALASELKIMVHLGRHLNVVNLLGACTKNVVKRELLVIVEYCRFGNLHNYLFRHRNDFIDQIDPKTGRIDYSIGEELLERTFSVSSDRSNAQTPKVTYVALSFPNSSNANGSAKNDMADYRGNSNYSGTTARTDSTIVCMTPSTGRGDDVAISSNNSVQPEWRSNYTGDYRGNVKPICTKELLVWAFQVARGMEYLVSRKVLHGDLAARNILLADEGVVKICDFGLAKNMYKDNNYKKRGDSPLPIKWMAIESIRDRVFSTQSDVWSFGIVLWEFFSLARTPYPGMEANEILYKKLVDGYRMDPPKYATNEIYQMMMDCWEAKPLSRPSFTKLADRIGTILEDNVRRHYIDLNDPYLVMNTMRLGDGQNDYLSMLSPPNYENLTTPHDYVNDIPFSPRPPSESSGYLCMNKNNGGGAIFNFESPKKGREEANTPELLPMLHNESDCETPTSPMSPNSVSNPTYTLPSIVTSGCGDKDILKSADNYVNMPQNKNVLSDKDKNCDKSPIEVQQDRGAVHYVNSTSRDWERL